jgi:hypothetical protein
VGIPQLSSNSLRNATFIIVRTIDESDTMLARSASAQRSGASRKWKLVRLIPEASRREDFNHDF